jgi:fructose PTS system EIIBC or EIIC component
MSDLITPALVRLDADLGSDKASVVRGLAAILGEAGRAHDVDRVAEDALAREGRSGTGLPGGLALPHCRTAGVEEPSVAFARLSPPVDFGAPDGPADLVILITAPTGGEATHLQLLTKLARALVKPAFTDALRDARSAEAAVDEIAAVLGPAR